MTASLLSAFLQSWSKFYLTCGTYALGPCNDVIICDWRFCQWYSRRSINTALLVDIHSYIFWCLLQKFSNKIYLKWWRLLTWPSNQIASFSVRHLRITKIATPDSLRGSGLSTYGTKSIALVTTWNTIRLSTSLWSRWPHFHCRYIDGHAKSPGGHITTRSVLPHLCQTTAQWLQNTSTR